MVESTSCSVGINNVCVLGSPEKVAGYFLSLLTKDIRFCSLEIFPANAFCDHGRKQSICLGYGRRIYLDTVNVTDLRETEYSPSNVLTRYY